MSVNLNKKEPIGCFWKIQKEGVTVGYLLGSIHRAPPYLLDLNRRIHNCFTKSHCLALEIDTTEQEADDDIDLESKKDWEEKYSNLSPKQIYNISDTLKKIFPKESVVLDFGKVKEKSDFIFECISRLESRVWIKAGIASGIDHKLHKLAKKTNKPIENLETISERKATLKMVLQQNPLQDLFLKVLSREEFIQLIDVPDIIDDIIKKAALQQSEKLKPLFNAWEEGNLEKFDASVTDSIDENKEMEERNLNIAIRVEKLISSKKRAFCCVGAAHTVGAKSVQSFLGSFGFSTKRIYTS